MAATTSSPSNLPPTASAPWYLRVWRSWITPRSVERERAFVERTLRGFMPIYFFVVLTLTLISVNILSFNFFTIILTMFLPTVAWIFLARDKVYISGTLIVLHLLMALIGLEFAGGYWVGAGTPIAMIILMLASLILPQRTLVWVMTAIIAVVGVVILVQTQNGIVAPLNQDGEPFTSPINVWSSAAFTLVLVLAYVSYLRREFNQRVNEVNELVNTLEARVEARTRDLAQANADAERARADAERARADAENANQIKSQFLAATSHELRTPLNAIINFSEFIKEGLFGQVNSEVSGAAANIAGSGKHLLALINDVLDISKIESGALQLFIEDDVPLRDELTALHQTALQLVKELPVEVRLDIHEPLPVLRADRLRVRQILLNLVSNACKFTERGSILISAKQQDDHVVVSVKDTGPGIRPADFETIFETFRQTEIGLRKGKGTGLGLPIARRLSEAHGGTLTVESVYGEGATFTVKLPIKSVELTPLA